MPLRFLENGLHEVAGSRTSTLARVCTGDGDVELTPRNALPGFADGHRGRRTGRRIGQVGATKVELDADPRGGRIVHAHQDREGFDPIGPLAVQRLVALVHRVGTPHGRADEHARSRAIGLRQVATGLAHRPTGSHQRKRAEPIEHAQLGGRKPIVVRELRRRGQRRRQSGSHRAGQAADARTPRTRIVVDLERAVAQRAHHTDARDGDSPHEGRNTDPAAVSFTTPRGGCAATTASM